MNGISGNSRYLLTRIGQLATATGFTIGCAESVTAGHLATRLAAAPGASSWFLGSVVAYSAATKHRVLGVPPGPVITASCATTMAHHTRELLGADIAIAVTGVGGPRPEENEPAGTVFICIVGARGTDVQRLNLTGSIEENIEATTERCFRAILDQLAELNVPFRSRV